jgi:hypothetical protein
MFHLRHVQGLYDLVNKKNMGPNNWKTYMDLLQNDEIATLRRIRCSETNCKSLRDSDWGCFVG